MWLQVPNIFPNDERQALMEKCRQDSEREGLKLETAVSVLLCGCWHVIRAASMLLVPDKSS
jgi:hypothetical protein